MGRTNGFLGVFMAIALMEVGLAVHIGVTPMHLEEEHALGVAFIVASVLTGIGILALIARPTPTVMVVVGGFLVAMSLAYFYVHNAGLMTTSLPLPAGIEHEAGQEAEGLWCVVTQVAAAGLLFRIASGLRSADLPVHPSERAGIPAAES
jgi:hypothetical protein